YGRLAWSVCADDLLAQPLQGLHWLHLQAGEADARALLHPMRNAVVQDLRFAGTARARPDGDFGRTEHEFVAELSVGRRVAEVRARLRIEKRNYAVSEMGRPAKAIRVQMLRAVDSLRDAGLRDSGHQTFVGILLRQDDAEAAVTAKAVGNLIRRRLALLIHVRGDVDPLEAVHPLKLVLDPLLLLTATAAEGHGESRVAIGGHAQGVDFAFGNDDASGVRRNRLPAEQDVLAVGRGGLGLNIVYRLANLDHR